MSFGQIQYLDIDLRQYWFNISLARGLLVSHKWNSVHGTHRTIHKAT